MRRDIFTEMKNASVNLYDESCRIEALFSENKGICNTYFDGYVKEEYLTLEEYINTNLFINWEHRQTYLSISDMRNALGISKEQLLNNPDLPLEQFLNFVEFISNLIIYLTINLPNNNLNLQDQLKYNSRIVGNNIYKLLDKLNYELSPADNRMIIIEKDSTTTAVSEIYEDISDKVIEYKRFALKGDLDRKCEILNTISKKYESICDKLKANGFTGIFHNVSFLINNIDIRHNNLEGPKAEKEVIGMSSDELESWYDKTYDMLLLALMLAHYIDIKSDIEGDFNIIS